MTTREKIILMVGIIFIGYVFINSLFQPKPLLVCTKNTDLYEITYPANAKRISLMISTSPLGGYWRPPVNGEIVKQKHGDHRIAYCISKAENGSKYYKVDVE
jgi:hypothetical protein